MAVKKKSGGGLESTLDVLRERADRIERVAAKHGRRHIFGRLGNLKPIRRNIVIWIGLLMILIVMVAVQTVLYNHSYRTMGPAGGSTYAEGVVGEISSFNPLYASTEDEVAASRLIYSSLLALDETNNLKPSVAESYSVSGDNLAYDVKLRPGVKWHGSDRTVTVDDVIFTTSLIQDPLTSSVLYDTWRSVKVDKIDDITVRFTLRTPLAMFPQALTFGILNREELSRVTPSEIREYLSENVANGSGPFVYHNTSTSQTKNKILTFSANPTYFGGTPNISSLTIETFTDDTAMVDGWQVGEVNVAVDVSPREIQDFAKANSSNIVATPINRGVYAIFNNSGDITKNRAIRQALRLAVDRSVVRRSVAVGELWPNELNSPISPGIYDSIDALVQPDFNQAEAGKMLDLEGWAIGNDKMRMSVGAPMMLEIVTLAGSDYELAANSLADQWRAIGIDARVTAADAATIQQNYIIPRAYDVLVYQLQLGADPDVYSYWHSSGAKAQGLNLANFTSPVSDLALSRGRTGVNREANYLTFAEDWLAKVPAIALYQSSYYSLQGTGINKSGSRTLADKSDRFRDVINFTVKTEPVFQTP